MRRALIILWLLMGATLLVASVPVDSYASALTDQVPQVSISLGQAAVQSGDLGRPCSSMKSPSSVPR